MLRRFLTLAAQLVLVSLSVLAADVLQRHMDIIPRWLVRLPEVDYSRADFRTVLIYFVAVHLVVLGITSWRLGPWRPADPGRTADEVFTLAVAFSAGALLVFVTTTVAFDPQFIVGIVLFTTLLTVLIHLASRVLRAPAATLLVDLARALLRRAFSIPGVLIIIFALFPGALAKLFVSDRDVANVITEIRIRIASYTQRHDWAVANALHGVRFRQPILTRFAPHRTDRVYVLERHGRLLEAPWGSPGEPAVLLDFRHRVGHVDVENGALGFAFHPGFGTADGSTANHVYVYYTSVLDGEQVNYLSRFSLAGKTMQERSSSEESLIVWDRDESGFHNGGSVEFGTDGFLYVAVGEMSDKASHQRIDQNLAGGILRIDVDRQGGDVSRPISRQPVAGETRGYMIPLDNPFQGVDGALGEFWALGLRNPFRISFDPQSGHLWAGEVGSTVWEEVNVVRAGHNYQYPYIEGREPSDLARPSRIIGMESGPVYTYQHTAYDRAVIGGVVYRRGRHPALEGRYIFGDNYSGKILAMPATGDPVEDVDVLGRVNQFAQRGLTSLTMSPDGELLLTTLGKGNEPTGEVLKLVPHGEAPPQLDEPEPRSAGTVGEEEAMSLYQTNCSRCHGVAGDGNGPDAGAMNVPMPDMTSPEFHASRGDARLRDVIREGGQAHGLSPMMPPWGQLLTEAEVDALVQVLRDLEKK